VKAIILAAGAGTRLNGSEVERPKCLASFGGRTLIDLQWRALRSHGIEDITVVVGFEADRVRRACRSGVRFVENRQFAETNSLYSLWLARRLLADGFVVLNCDVLFHPALLGDLLTAAHDSALLVSYAEGERAFGTEEMKVRVRRGRVVEISKELPDERIDGENVGIVKFSAAAAGRLVEILDELVDRGQVNDWAPRAFGAYAREAPLFAVGTRGLPWTEIDTADDYEDATQRVFPAIQSDPDALWQWESAGGQAPAVRRGA
jgi:choline kinase